MNIEQNINNGNLSELRIEILEALNTFLSHVKNAINLLITMVAGAIAIIVFITKDIGAFPQLLLWVFAGIVFVLLMMMSWYSIKICRRYYLIYASNYIYYARVHYSLDNAIKHPWVDDLKIKQGFRIESLYTKEAMYNFTDNTGDLKSEDKNSWQYYKILLSAFGFFGLAGSLICFWQAFSLFCLS